MRNICCAIGMASEYRPALESSVTFFSSSSVRCAPAGAIAMPTNKFVPNRTTRQRKITRQAATAARRMVSPGGPCKSISAVGLCQKAEGIRSMRLNSLEAYGPPATDGMNKLLTRAMSACGTKQTYRGKRSLVCFWSEADRHRGAALTASVVDDPNRTLAGSNRCSAAASTVTRYIAPCRYRRTSRSGSRTRRRTWRAAQRRWRGEARRRRR